MPRPRSQRTRRSADTCRWGSLRAVPKTIMTSGPIAGGGSISRRSSTVRSSMPNSSDTYLSRVSVIFGAPLGISGSGGGSCINVGWRGGSTWRYQGTSEAFALLFASGAGCPSLPSCDSSSSCCSNSLSFGALVSSIAGDLRRRVVLRNGNVEKLDVAVVGANRFGRKTFWWTLRVSGAKFPTKSRRADRLQAEQRAALSSGPGPDPRPWRRRKDYRALVGFERNLATAMAEPRIGDDIPEIPFEGLPPGMGTPYSAQGMPLYELRPFDVASTVMVEEPEDAKPRTSRVNIQGIPGDRDELLSVFNACIQVGRLNRAALVLKRLVALQIMPPELMLELHNRYLQARIEQLEADPGKDQADELHKWFESQFIGKGLNPDPQTVAYMIKATLLVANSRKRRERVARYVSMLPQETAMEALAWEIEDEILSAEDLAAVSEICPALTMPEDVSALLEAQEAEGSEAGEAALGVDAELAEGVSENIPSAGVPSSLPEVLSTPQKGVGLKSLKETLSMFDDIPDGFSIDSLPMRERREVQSKLEKDCVDAAISRWRDESQSLSEMGLSSALSSAALSSKLSEWHGELARYLEHEFELIKKAELAERKSPEDTGRLLYGPHLLQSTPSRLAAVTILCTLSMLSMLGAGKAIPLAHVVSQIAKVTEEDIRAQLLAKTMPPTKKQKQTNVRQLLRQARMKKTASAASAAGGEDKASAKLQPWEFSWPLSIKTKVGAILLMGLMDTARITVVREHPETKELVSQSQPAFSHTMQLKKGRKVGALLPNRALVDIMKSEPRAEVLARHLPMVVEPEPWSKFDKGGFLEHSSPLLRLKGGERDQRIYADAAIERGDMEQMFRGLDVLGKTAWKINRPVFDVMLEAWNSGKELANLPALNPEIPIPPEPDSTDDPMKRRVWLKSIKAAENEKSGLHSVRCFMNFQLEIARAFRDQTFYFPHNLDFRGRAYPIPTYLNHMGADHMRGVLMFAKGRELGESGLRWLKVHTSNVFGFDKASLQEREDFTTANLEEVFDSAENPLSGNRWWLKAEDPWQCLAACMELKAAYSLPDPTKHVSHLPVHQDGTCNGLQHYAALGGDTWGAQQVNLIPGDRPADVYSAVADIVKQEIAKDIGHGNQIAQALDGKITRKVVKQTVMTNVYGVTFVGAKKQVQKQLDSLYPDLTAQCGIDSSLLASYIATKIFGGLSSMFRGAHDIQTWLGEIGGRVCRALTPEQLDRIAKNPDNIRVTKRAAAAKATNKPRQDLEELSGLFRSTLVWTTPLRMPVCQPYRTSSSRKVATCLQNLILTDESRSDPVNRRKQLQAFPPNFIHSLDATHMMLSALECHAHGLDFAAVHDSFWTHAADVDTMNHILRDCFIRMHSEDVIGRLKAEFETRYRGCIYLAKTDTKSVLGQQIVALRKVRKNNSSYVKDELLQEKLRQDLLKSADPEKVKQGREMVTPASLFESVGSEDMITNGLEAEAASDELSEDIQEFEGEEDVEGLGEDEEGKKKKKGTRQKTLADDLNSMSGTNYFKAEMAGNLRSTKKAPARKNEIQFWMPLTFPDIPKKGDFDVQQLKKSKYFFS
ncbi:hypothetical protein QBC42DRAFT_305002 [Cladorrhinum samala]|uniref:DNA-directed RNA polymerase n=1 Tax=Cladorrhinum samala TaxID=585594 RepID=A0AAV9HS92_9PEZI|nr:hypothetical protein QBC42DRAFT_305002 [Cladorrhinum samala]